MSQLYVLQDLNDPNKLKVEERSDSSGTICPISKELSEQAFILEDVIDPHTLEVIGKQAVLDEDAELLRLAQLDSDMLEAKWEILRQARNKKLADCDYTQLLDITLTAQELTDWQDYRQALRDLPANTVDPESPNWPVKPS